jgi:hypothetical protein
VTLQFCFLQVTEGDWKDFDFFSAFDVLLKEAYRVAAFVMSYSFTRPPSDDHEEPSGNQENLDEDDSEVDEEATSVGNALMEVPLMIPVADFLNASVHKNNAKLHWNDNDEKFLTMISTKPISAVRFIWIPRNFRKVHRTEKMACLIF